MAVWATASNNNFSGLKCIKIKSESNCFLYLSTLPLPFEWAMIHSPFTTDNIPIDKENALYFPRRICARR